MIALCLNGKSVSGRLPKAVCVWLLLAILQRGASVAGPPSPSELSMNAPIYLHLGHKNSRQVISFLCFVLNPGWIMDKIQVHFRRAASPQQQLGILGFLAIPSTRGRLWDCAAVHGYARVTGAMEGGVQR